MFKPNVISLRAVAFDEILSISAPNLIDICPRLVENVRSLHDTPVQVPSATTGSTDIIHVGAVKWQGMRPTLYLNTSFPLSSQKIAFERFADKYVCINIYICCFRKKQMSKFDVERFTCLPRPVGNFQFIRKWLRIYYFHIMCAYIEHTTQSRKWSQQLL